jgi:hypothetical protein
METYIKPAVETISITYMGMFASSTYIYDHEVDTEKDGTQLSNEHRGTWGNLWKDNE